MKFKRSMSFLVALMFATTTSVAIAQAPRIPTMDFFKDAEAESLTLSPTGEYMTVVVPKGDHSILVAMRTDDMKPLGKWEFGTNNFIGRTVWVNNDRIAIYLAKRVPSQETKVLMPNILFSNVDGTDKKFVEMGAYYQLVSTTPDDPRHITVSQSRPNAVLYKMNVYSGNVTKVAAAPLEPGSFLVNKKGEPAFAIGSKLNDTKTYVLRRDGDSWKQISVTERGEAGTRPLKLASDGRHAYLAVSDKGEPERLVLRDMETGQEKVLQPSHTSDIEGTVSNFDGENIAAVWYEDGVPYYEFLDEKSPEASIFGGIINSIDDKVVSFRGKSDDGNKILFAAYSDTDPGSYYLFDRKTGKARFLMAAMPWIKPAQMAQMNPITVTARDGTKIHGFLTTPNGSNGKNLPLIMHPHGGPHGPRDEWGFNPEVQFLANRGYAIVQMNFRGSGGYGTAFEKMGYRNWGTTMIDDMTDVVKHLIKEGTVNPKRICTYGASYGGYAALQSVIREPDLYSCAIGYVGVYDLDQLAKDSDIQSSHSGREYLKRVYPTTVEERRAQSPVYNVSKIKVPVMLIHGALDERVPMTQFYRFTQALKDAGKGPEEMLVEQKEAHGFQLPENQVKAADRTEAFLNKHIGPGK